MTLPPLIPDSRSCLIRFVSSPVKAEDGSFFVLVLLRTMTRSHLRIFRGGSRCLEKVGVWAHANRKNPCGPNVPEWAVIRFKGMEFCFPMPYNRVLTDEEEIRVLSSCISAFTLREDLLQMTGFRPKQEPETGECQPHKLCVDCGKCCLIYRPEKRGGSLPTGFTDEQMRKAMHPSPEKYSVSPLTSPVRSGACEYLGESGCIIQWDRRPRLCKTYRCPEWREGWI